MTLIDAPAYDSKRADRIRNGIIAVAVLLVLLVVLTLLGYIMGHGWLFSNLPTEHRVNAFYQALEAKDYAKAYGIYENDPHWQQHQDRYASYPLQRFTEDWTTYNPVGAPIVTHHIDVSRTDGTGTFGTGIIVGATLNGNADKRSFIYVNRSDGTFTYPAPHIIEY